VPRDQPELLSDLGDGEGLTLAVPGLLYFPAILLPVPFAGQRLLGPELLTRLQIEGVSFDLLDDVLLLDFPLEAAKGVL